MVVLVISVQFSSVQSLSRVHLFATPWTAARQASPSIATSQSLLELMSTEPVMHFVVLPYSFHPRPIPQRGKLSPDGLSDSSMSFALWAPTPALLGDFLTAPAGLFVGVWPWVGGGGGQILFHLVLNTISPHFPPAAGLSTGTPGNASAQILQLIWSRVQLLYIPAPNRISDCPGLLQVTRRPLGSEATEGTTPRKYDHASRPPDGQLWRSGDHAWGQAVTVARLGGAGGKRIPPETAPLSTQVDSHNSRTRKKL